jgi:4'-phosphopantetheinyl transferase EntD
LTRDALRAILPASVSVATSRTNIADVPLFPEEAAAVERAVEQRRREFATGRACARAALEQLGLSRQPIPTGSRGEPRWPAGIVGSITHCDGFRACAVARQTDLLTIGIDAEPHRPLPDRILADVAFGDELALVQRLGDAAPRVHWDRVLFSAKESVYKAWFTLTGRQLGFEDAALAIDALEGTFAACLRPEEEPRRLSGRWAVESGIVLTAVAVAR